MFCAIFLQGERGSQVRGTWFSSVSIVVVPNGYRKSLGSQKRRLGSGYEEWGARRRSGTPFASQASISCANHCLCSISYLQLAEDVGDVVLHGLDAEGETLSNGGVAFALCDQVKDVPFALGQLGEAMAEAVCGSAAK